ncbi:DUF6879 family protein [Streptomyces sp. NPDC004610]|uniref:DUF6879 family protein n=1 Tax=unclassified Streptomyces TaxID=2593676 RepID=UPI0033A280BB
MDLITPAERDELFKSFERDAFHLELRDDYGSPVEDTPYARWRRGEPDDFSWLVPWMQLMKRVTSDGRAVRRVCGALRLRRASSRVGIGPGI